MKKRTLSLLLALVMVCGLLPMTALAATLDNGLEYKVHEDHVEITDCPRDAFHITIPATIEGLPVTKIGNSAFALSGKLLSVNLPETITFIGNRAFQDCKSLLSINIPENVTTIDDYAFENCESLLSITIPESVTSINRATFRGCVSLNSVNLPDGLISIDRDAFTACQALTSIDLPDSITSIGSGVFQGCSNLRSIDIPDGITAIDWCTFEACSSLTDINLPNSLISIGGSAFLRCTSLACIDIPEGVVSIGDQAFLGCTSLACIDIPEGVISIGDGAFCECSGLTDIDLPDSLLSIGQGAFTVCQALTSITIPGHVTLIRSNAFSGCINLTSIYFEGDAPWMAEDVFFASYGKTTATAYYPAENPTWTADVMQDYGGDITWVPYNPNNPFTDVPADAFYEEPVLWAVENSITTGATADSFNPNGSCLRAHVVTFLHRAAQNPEPSSTNNPFTDVKSSDFFYKPVLWAVEKNITNGTSADQFGSFATCNRAAVVTFLWRAAGSPEPESTDNPFVDVKPTDFFYKAVLWAIENGITNGVDATHFGPTTACNRAQVVTFLYRAYN